VIVINPSSSLRVIWQVGSSATIGTGTAFVGNILAFASITLTTGASLSGRALALGGAVTMDNNAVSCGSCDGIDEIAAVDSPDAVIKVNGGGQIQVPKPDSEVASATGTGRATFTVHALKKLSGVVTGRLTYLNHLTRQRIAGSIDDVVVIENNLDASPKTVRLSGTCGGNLPDCLLHHGGRRRSRRQER
jgi:hypothetical protein